jgi:hypothetical protein
MLPSSADRDDGSCNVRRTADAAVIRTLYLPHLTPIVSVAHRGPVRII